MYRNHRKSHTFVEKQKALLIALLFVTVLDLFVSVYSTREIRNETTKQVEQLVKLHTEQVYDVCSRVSINMQRLLMENMDIARLAMNGDERERVYAKARLLDKIGYSFSAETEKHFFFYFRKTGEVLADSWILLQDAKESGMVDTILNRIRTDENMVNDLYRWEYFEQDGQYYMLRAYAYENVWFVCYFPAESMIRSLQETYQDGENQVLLMSSDGTILWGKEQLEEGEIPQQILEEGGTFYKDIFHRIEVIREESKSLSLSVAVVMRGFSGFSRILLLQFSVLFLVLLTLGAFVLMTVYTKYRIIAPVQKFVKGLQDYQEGAEKKEELSVNDIHDLEQINEQFRNFVHQIGALKISIYEEKLQRQKLEMDNMKLQIRPHFFLNSLSAIYRLLETERIEDAKKMCMATIRYLRYLFRADMDSVQLQGAIAHMDDYFEIMKLRYPGEVELDEYVEEAAKNLFVPPLLIQTLTENAFKYGKRPDVVLEISVTVTMEMKQGEKYLCINVSDNGNGFPEEYLKLWEEGKELDTREGEHLGIANVRARLEYGYHGRAQCSFYNSPLGGAVVEIYIPVEEETHESAIGG